MKAESSVLCMYWSNSSLIPALNINSVQGHRHDFASAPLTELALGSSYDWRAELELEDAS
jgi:hypothetical protein